MGWWVNIIRPLPAWWILAQKTLPIGNVLLTDNSLKRKLNIVRLRSGLCQIDRWAYPLRILTESMSARIITNPQTVSDPNLLPFRFALKAYIKEEKLKIPVLPDVVAQVMELINHPSVNANTLARLIHKDQALAGYVLRVSNSPIYAGSKEILTLRQAIARIGARTLGKIALSVTMQGKVFKAPGYEEVMTSLWRLSLTAGALAQDIGNIRNNPSETLYLCGLLHTVGKPVILQALDELKGEFNLSLSHEGGLALMEEFHRDAGGRIAQQWKLPEPVRAAAMHYQEPLKAEEYGEQVCITFLAHKIAQFLDIPAEEEDILAMSSHPIVNSLKLNETVIRTLFGRLEKIREILEAMKV